MYCLNLIIFMLFFIGMDLPQASAQSKIDRLLGTETFKDYTNVKIEKVLKSDTILLESGEQIRLIGLSAPEVPQPKGNRATDEYGFPIEEKISPLIPIDERAYEFAKNLLEGQKVRLELDIEKTSDDFKTWAYIFLSDGTLANTEILRHGFAHLQIVFPNMKYVQQLREAYQEAKREKRGLQSDY